MPDTSRLQRWTENQIGMLSGTSIRLGGRSAVGEIIKRAAPRECAVTTRQPAELDNVGKRPPPGIGRLGGG